MHINRQGLEIIKNAEGLRLQAYFCPAGVLTIGYGHTGPDVSQGLTITEDEADELLQSDLARFEPGVEELMPADCSRNQFSALVSFAYNVGVNALAKSTLLRKFLVGDLEGAAYEFSRWTRAGGRVLPGLVRRRADEMGLFLTPGDGDDA